MPVLKERTTPECHQPTPPRLILMSSNEASATAHPTPALPASTKRASIRAVLGRLKACVEEEKGGDVVFESGTLTYGLLEGLVNGGVDISVVMSVLSLLKHVPWLGPVVETLDEIFQLYQVCCERRC